MEYLKQSTARNILVFMADSSDHITGKTSLTLTINMAKEGSSFSSVTPSVTEKGYGWYQLALTTIHTDTLGNLLFHITGSGADPCDKEYAVSLAGANSWDFPIRTLTIPGVLQTSASPTEVYCRRGDTLNVPFVGLGSLSGYDSIYFTVKEYYKKDTDSESVLQVVRRTSGSSGLLYLNSGSVADMTSGSITINNLVTGNINVMVKPDATKELPVKDTYYYDVEAVYTSGSVLTLAEGSFVMLADVTRAIT